MTRKRSHAPGTSDGTRSAFSRRAFTRGAAALPVAAYASGVTPAVSRATSAQDDVHLVLLTHWGTELYRDEFERHLAEYQELNPNVTVEMQTVAFAELLNRITTGQLGGDAPDIYHFYNLWLPDFSASQLFAPPPDDIVAEIEEAYAPGTVGGATFNDQVWGYPTEVNVWQLIYNLEMFAEAGIENPPATWDELRDAAEQLTVRDGDEVVRAGLLLFDTWDSGVVHPWTSLLWSNGGEYVADDYSEALFNSPEGLETLQLQVDLINEGAAMSSILEDNDFLTGQAAMTIMANFWGADLRAGMEGGIENVGVGPIPTNGDNESTAVQYQWLWGVGNTSQQQEEAWRFLQWLNSPRDGEGTSSPMGDFLTSGLNAIPARLSDQQAHEDVVGGPFVGPFVDALQTSRTEPIIPGAQEIKTSLQTQIEAAWFGQKSPDEALADSEAEANRILAERG